MSAKNFQILYDTTMDNWIIKSDFTNIHHQQGAQLIESDKNIDIISGKNNRYHQIRNAYLQFDIQSKNVVMFLKMIILILLD